MLVVGATAILLFTFFSSIVRSEPVLFDSNKFVSSMNSNNFVVKDETTGYLNLGIIENATAAYKDDKVIKLFVTKTEYDAHSVLFNRFHNVFKNDMIDAKIKTERSDRGYDIFIAEGYSITEKQEMYRYAHREGNTIIVAEAPYNSRDNFSELLDSL